MWDRQTNHLCACARRMNAKEEPVRAKQASPKDPLHHQLHMITISSPWSLTAPHGTASSLWSLTAPHGTNSSPWHCQLPMVTTSSPWHCQLRMLSKVWGFEMQITVQQSPTSAKQFHSHQITLILSLQVGGESKYPSGSQSPGLVWLFLGRKDQSPGLSSCTSWFSMAWRQQSEMGFPDSPGHHHPLTLWQTAFGTLRVKAGKPCFLLATASQEAQALSLSPYRFEN